MLRIVQNNVYRNTVWFILTTKLVYLFSDSFVEGYLLSDMACHFMQLLSKAANTAFGFIQFPNCMMEGLSPKEHRASDQSKWVIKESRY